MTTLICTLKKETSLLLRLTREITLLSGLGENAANTCVRAPPFRQILGLKIRVQAYLQDHFVLGFFKCLVWSIESDPL